LRRNVTHCSFTSSNRKPIKCVLQTTLSIKTLMFELKETQNNQGHSLNLQYIPAVPLRVAVGGKLFILYISYHFTLLGNCQV